MNTHPTQAIAPEELVQAIRTCTGEVFATMLGIEINAGDTLAESSEAIAPTSGLVALVGLAGTWSGTGSVSCTGQFACQMASQLLMSQYDSLNEDVLDAMGEVANMIIGNVKTHLEEKIGPMGLSTPTVIYGRNFQTRSARVHKWTIVPFSSGEERLYVQLCLAPNREFEGESTRLSIQLPQVLTI